MSDVAIKVNNAGKKFCKSLKKSMFYGAMDLAIASVGVIPDSRRLRDDEFWALKNVSFEVKKGETLGLIGPNGSGKSTLLKMLNGIYMPDEGDIQINGKVGALIEVGAGFHPMLSGRENIYINGAILGMKKKEIDQKFEQIVSFADIGDFIDAPVKHYSSGMYVRLGFAIAVHSEPEILLVDEILAVGDRDFSVKCYQKMHEIQKSGVSIILVSHNEHLIRERTTRCLYLSGGKEEFLGSSEEGINLYIKHSLERKQKRKEGKISKDLSNKAEIINIKFFDKNHNEVSEVESGEELNIEFELKIKEHLEKLILGVNFYGEGNFMYCVNSEYENVELSSLNPGSNSIQIHIPQLHLPVNKYSSSAIIAEDNVTNLVDWHDMIYSLTVLRAPNSRGSLKLPNEWKVIT